MRCPSPGTAMHTPLLRFGGSRATARIARSYRWTVAQHHVRSNSVPTLRITDQVLLIAVERELAGWEWHKHMAQRPEIDLDVNAATLLEEDSSNRYVETG